MQIIKIKTDSLAQLSYLIIDGNQAVVIDPRRDAEIYYNKARERGAEIKYIFETHRNEDFVTGSRELERHCGAKIYHGEGLDFRFGNYVRDGERFELDEVCLKVIETPGHTPESISLSLFPDRKCEQALAVFTGDALFVNDVGRTDFYKERKELYASKLYDSIHNKILPLGDQVVLYPAHGAGSVCGGGIADREVSTLGYEKNNNPMLQLSKKDFIKKKVSESHQMPPYFEKMEEVNLKGNDLELVNYKHLELKSVNQLRKDFFQVQVVDIRTPEAYLGCHIPKSLSIPKSLLAAYGGYFLNYQDPIVLVGDNIREEISAKNELINLGFDNVKGFLNGGITAWETSGEELGSISMVDVHSLSDENLGLKTILLDVRKPDEWKNGIIEDAKTVFLGDLVKNLKEFRAEDSIVTYCGSGKRATIAASLLQKHGFSNVKVFMGSMKAYEMKESA